MLIMTDVNRKPENISKESTKESKDGDNYQRKDQKGQYALCLTQF